MSTRIGQLRERIAIKRKVRARRADGGNDVTMSTLAVMWASVEPVAAREGEQAGRMYGATSFLLKVRADELPAGFNADDQIEWVTGGNALFNVRGIRKQGFHSQYAEIVAEQGPLDSLGDYSGSPNTFGEPVGLLLVLTKAA